MKRFQCACGQRLAFENVQCLACGRRLAFAPERLELVTLEALQGDLWRIADDASGQARRLCLHYEPTGICNWLCAPRDDSGYCLSCAMTHEIPDLRVAGNLERWMKIEAAKRRLIYGLLALHLPLKGGGGNSMVAAAGLRFSFVAETPTRHVVSGHENGLITLAITEADDAARASIRETLGEPYRTLLGHLRHEAGHYYWARLVAGSGWLSRCRALFGDETIDYAAALERHYREGPPAHWPDTHVSAYASAHPYEDWAETWAHYLHIRDMLETAQAHGIRVSDTPGAPAQISDHWDFNLLVQAWLPVILAVNDLNRSMGLPDMYPFVLPPAALDKLQFVHDVVTGVPQGWPTART